jgi:hypothetical protein
MKNFILLLLTLVSLNISAYSQGISIYGFYPTGSSSLDYVLLAEIDPLSGNTISMDSVRPINGYALGSSAFDSYNQAFTFIGVDTDLVFRMVSRNVIEDTTLWAPAFNQTITDLQHDMRTLGVYGLGNYLVNPSAGEYALRLLQIDQQTGEITELNRMPEAIAFPAGSSTFDANTGRYIVSIIDNNFQGRLYAIEAQTGTVLSDNLFNLPPYVDILNLEYNNRDDLVYGLMRNINTGFFAIASLDIESASIKDTIYVIEDLQYFVQGSSVFHQMSQNYIFYYVDNDNNSRLMSVDVSAGGITANPLITDYLTELEVDNYDYAMMAYHGTVNTNDRNQPEEDSFIIFPNPASDRVSIRFHDRDIAHFTLKIYDSSGRMIDDVMLPNAGSGSQEINLDIQGLAPGYYHVKTIFEDHSEVQRLLIVR